MNPLIYLLIIVFAGIPGALVGLFAGLILLWILDACFEDDLE